MKHNFCLSDLLTKSNRTTLQSYKVEERTFGTPCKTNILIYLYYELYIVFIFVLEIYASVNSTCARPPPPTGLLRSICTPCQSGGWGICKFCPARGPDIRQPRGHSRGFDTHAVSQQNITTQKVLLEKKQIGSSIKDRNKLKRVVKACSRFYECVSSLLIKPELHSEIGAIDVNQRFLVIESNFCSYYLKNILSYL